MKKGKINFVILSFTLLSLCSCLKEENSNVCIFDSQSEAQVIPLNDAIKTLGAFMAEIEPGRPLTKSGLTREISSIDTHYKTNAFTKSGDPMPDAYVLNFANDEGFAVLGANTNVAPIVALTEDGSIDVNSLDADDDDRESFEPSLDEFGDFVCCERRNFQLVENLLQDGIETGRGAATGRRYAVVNPMLGTKWAQGNYDVMGVYNKYCQRKGGGYAYAGCSTIAIAQIIAYNAANCSRKYPINYINGIESLDCVAITSKEDATMLDVQTQEQVSLLIGWIFDNTSRFFTTSAGTAISAASIANFLRDDTEWHDNVYKYEDNCFSNDMIQATSNMLGDGKPVYISAFTDDLFDGHSWVIDGAKYASDGHYQGDWMVHCNWGWSGKSNGYFSVNCLLPEDQNAELDPGVAIKKRTGEFVRLFRLVTYDLKIN